MEAISTENERFYVLQYHDQALIQYQYRMIRKFPLRHLVQISHLNDKDRHLLYYDLSGKEALPRLLTERTFAFNTIENLMTSLIQLAKDMDNHFLELKYLDLNMDQIYYDMTSQVYCFVYVPIEDSIKIIPFKERFFALVDQLLETVDMMDYKAVSLIHRLSMMKEEDSFTLDRLERLLKTVHLQDHDPMSTHQQVTKERKLPGLRRFFKGPKVQSV